MDRYGFMTAADVIRYMPDVSRNASEDKEEEAEEEEEQEEEQEGEEQEQEEEQEPEEAEEQEQEQEQEQEEEEEEEEEEKEEEEEEEEEEGKEHDHFGLIDFTKDRRFEDDRDNDGSAFQERLRVRDMGAASKARPREIVSKPQVSEDIFYAAPSACPTTLSDHLRQMGADITPTESDITGSNYSDHIVDDEDGGGYGDADFVGDPETNDQGLSGKEKGKKKTKGKTSRFPRELREIARHLGDNLFNNIQYLTHRFNVSFEDVKHLAMIDIKYSRDGNTWNDFQTWMKIKDPLRNGESGKFVF
jgi:flagellar motor protein MotB